MITSANLKTLNYPDMAGYFSAIAINFMDGKTAIARQQFIALSAKQRKAFILHLNTEWQSAAGDPMHDFFFEKL